jgi:hypothetical protein
MGEALGAARREFIEAQAAGNGLWSAIELVQVIVFAPHRRLYYRVHCGGCVGRHLGPAPDRRFGVGQNNLKTKDGLAHSTRRAGADRQFQGQSLPNHLAA